MIRLNRKDIGSALLFIVGIAGMIYGLQELFLFAFLDEELLGELLPKLVLLTKICWI